MYSTGHARLLFASALPTDLIVPGQRYCERGLRSSVACRLPPSPCRQLRQSTFGRLRVSVDTREPAIDSSSPARRL